MLPQYMRHSVAPMHFCSEYAESTHQHCKHSEFLTSLFPAFPLSYATDLFLCMSACMRTCPFPCMHNTSMLLCFTLCHTSAVYIAVFFLRCSLMRVSVRPSCLLLPVRIKVTLSTYASMRCALLCVHLLMPTYLCRLTYAP